MRAGLGLMFSLSTNAILKLAFHAPRPYWIDARVQPFSSEHSFGIPSGHSQNSVVLWSLIAERVRRPLGWVLAIAMILLVSFSRMLPWHALSQRCAGGLAVWRIASLGVRSPRETGLQLADSATTFAAQVSIVFAASLGLILVGALVRGSLGDWETPSGWVELAARQPDGAPIAPLALSGLVSSAATFFGLALGGILLQRRGWLDAGGPYWQRLVRFLVGVAGVFVIRYGLDMIFPDGETFVPLIFRYLRYAFIGLWVAYLAPLCFFRLKIAHPKYQ